MKRLLLLLTLCLAWRASAQNANTLTIRFPGVPSGPCATFCLGVNNATNDEYNYGTDGAWHKISGGSAGNLTGPITSVGLATSIAATGVVAQKPIGGSTGDAIEYVSCNGNDSNDGLSWGTAKATVYGALIALPGGKASGPPTAGNGTVLIATGASPCSVWGGLVNPQSTSGTGIWIMGSSDPNAGSPPTGWLRQSTSGSLVFKGVSGWATPANGQGYYASISAGAIGNSFSTAGHPAVWLSGVSDVTFENISFADANQSILIGIDSNGNRHDGGATNIAFHNVHASTNTSSAAFGPTIDVGSDSFWLWFSDMQVEVNTAAAVGNDKRAAFLFDGGAGNTPGLIKIINTEVNGGGGIKLRTNGSSIPSLYVYEFSIEGAAGGHGDPGVWVTGTSGVQVVANSVNLADYSDLVPAVLVDNTALPPDDVTVIQPTGAGPNVTGPAIVLGQSVGVTQSATISAFQQHQAGFWSGSNSQITSRVIGQVDVSRRAFGPAAVRFTNLANTSPANWAADSGATPTITAVTAPDGTPTGAGRIAAAGVTAVKVYRQNITAVVGDWFIFGVWARSQTANGLDSGTAGSVSLIGGGGPYTITGSGSLQQRLVGDGQWDWYGGLFKLTSGAGSPDLIFDLRAGASNTVEFYAPILLRISSGTVSDNEAFEIANHLQSYSNLCATAGQICGLPGQILTESVFGSLESAAPTGIANTDLIYGDSTAHRFKMINNNGTATQVVASGVDINTSDQVTATHLASALPVNQGGTGNTGGTITYTIANGTSALGTGAISSGACATVVTTSATGTATTDNIMADFNADPTGVTGYAPSSSGMLTIIKYPTSNNVNFKVCNNTAGSITPGAITLNWRVVR